MNRYKKRGWFNESHRHYLAAKGVKTKNYFAKKAFPDFGGKSDKEQLEAAKIAGYVKPNRKGESYESMVERGVSLYPDEFMSRAKRVLTKSSGDDVKDVREIKFLKSAALRMQNLAPDEQDKIDALVDTMSDREDDIRQQWAEDESGWFMASKSPMDDPAYAARVRAEERYYDDADKRYEKNRRGRKVLEEGHDADLVAETPTTREWVSRVTGEIEREKLVGGRWVMV
jgi:hypothetical protein